VPAAVVGDLDLGVGDGVEDEALDVGGEAHGSLV
jgi:hypothetical protein